MTFHIVTLFPEAIEPYFKSSIVGKARQKGLVKVRYYNLLDFTANKHGRIDDRPYGGGPGMVLQIEPILKAVKSAKSKTGKSKVKIILFSASGKQFNNKTASRLAENFNHLILISGRYEGIDERIKKILKDEFSGKGGRLEELSIGPYVLTGGELPAMLLVDAVSRQIKGVLGKGESLEEKRSGVGVPAYTRPEIFTYRRKKYRVPQVLLSGNHTEIEKWRKGHKKGRGWQFG